MKKINSILLVDDDDIINYLNKIIITRMDIALNVESVRSGDMALEYLKKITVEQNQQPELILLDINMPRMDGWQFLEEYKNIKHEFLKEPIIVMFTTSINPDDREKARHIVEVSGFKCKPLSEQILNELLLEFPELTN
ncbi:MAG: response regulator [Thalassobius sp.]|nr:response regulator [Thalassovita sp.]